MIGLTKRGRRNGTAMVSTWICFLLLLPGVVQGADGQAPRSSVSLERFELDLNLSRLYRFTVNTYIVFNVESRDAIMIDPGLVDKRVDRFIKTNRLKLRAILNTHGHRDHTGGNAVYARRYKAPIYAPGGDRDLYRNQEQKGRPRLLFYSPDQELICGTLRVRVIHIGGHSPGSSCFLIAGMLFSGDSLLAGSVGKPEGESEEDQKKNLELEIHHIRERLLTLPDGTPVFPGHDAPSTIGRERRRNTWLKKTRESPSVSTDWPA